VPPEKLGKYEIRGELGRGAMGVVYQGYDPLIKRAVALKTIRSDQLAGDAAPALLARFRREAEAAGRLSHPNIVPIYDFDEDHGTWFIAMELVKGRELKEYFEANERFKPADTVRIMTQILDALDYSHRQGVVHRDIKPANVFLLDDGTVKVADFGIAHIESSNLTQVGTIIGTPAYMSPEQIMGLPVDGRSDLFSAGVILYQFLAGERPFSGSSTTTMQKVLKEEPLAPSILNIQVPLELDAVVRKALAKRPDERYQTAREFADALKAASQATAAAPVEDPDATLKPADAARIAAAPRPASTQASSSAPATTPAVPRSRAPALAVAAGAAVALVAAGAWYASQRPGADVVVASKESPAQPTASGPAAKPVTTTPPAKPMTIDPGKLVITALGLADPASPRYRDDKSLLSSDARADARGQLVEKALMLLLDRRSLAKNYGLLKDRLLSQSDRFVNAVVQESEPRLGKDGLMSITTQAVVDVRAIQHSLNEMSRAERVQLIRANGDPRIAVQIGVRDAERTDAPSQPSPVAENVVKKRIQQFGFRTWSGSPSDAAASGPDFVVSGEAKIKKLLMRLEASGLTITKYALSSWTVKCVERATGEEIYFNTALPGGLGSWASEEEALAVIGSKIADEFSRDFFLSHISATGRPIVIVVDGLPKEAGDDVTREIAGLPAVIAARAKPASKARAYDVQIAGDGAIADRVASDVLAPLNAKLGDSCFSVGATSGDQVDVMFDQRCASAPVLSRLETNPPAALYGALPDRKKAVVKNPDTLRKVLG
jgi:serine/threonine-protein kinase